MLISRCKTRTNDAMYIVYNGNNIARFPECDRRGIGTGVSQGQRPREMHTPTPPSEIVHEFVTRGMSCIYSMILNICLASEKATNFHESEFNSVVRGGLP